MKILLITFSLLFCCSAHAASWQENSEIAELFSLANVNGTFVLYDATKDQYIGHNRARAEQRFVPASTFKIPHSLIGLSVGAVAGVDEVLPYGGKPQPFKVWEKDMGLREAIKISNVPIYQALARRIGKERMQQSLIAMDYGNTQIGKQIDRFWLEGPLQISAVEQTLFLHRLTQSNLPFPAPLQQTVQDLVLLDGGVDCALYGKTGWENAPDPGIGWWVGWVRMGKSNYPFALNIDVKTAADAGKRVELGKASLRALGIWK